MNIKGPISGRQCAAMSICRHEFAQWCRMRAKGTFWEQLQWTRRKHSRASPSVQSGVNRVKAERSRGAHTEWKGESLHSLSPGFQKHLYFLCHHSQCPAEHLTLRINTRFQCVFPRKCALASLALVGFCYLQNTFWWLSYPVKTYAGPLGQAVQAQATVPMKTAMRIRHWQTTDHKSDPTHGLFLQIKFYLDTATLIHLCIIYGHIHVTTTELSSCHRLYGLETPKYLLLGPL